MRIRASCHEAVGWAKAHGTARPRGQNRRCAFAHAAAAVQAILPTLRSLASHQILLRYGGAERVVVGDELADELVQAALEDFVHAAVLQAGADGARLALR